MSNNSNFISKNRTFWSYWLLVLGISITIASLLIKFITSLFLTNLKSFLEKSELFSPTSFQLLEGLSTNILLLGITIITSYFLIKLSIKHKTSLENAYSKLTTNKYTNFFKKYPVFFLCSLIVIMTSLSYHQVLDTFFIFDDLGYILEGMSSPWSWVFSFDLFFWRPVQSLYFKVMGTIFGANHVAFHFSILAFHCINNVLIFYIIRKIRGDNLLAFLVCLVFISRFCLFYTVFTICNEPILALFLLSAFLFYLHGGQNKYSSVLAHISFFLALLTKSVAITFPMMLFTYELIMVPRKQARVNKIISIIKKHIVYYMILIGYIGIRIYKSTFFANIPKENMYHIKIGINIPMNLLNYFRFSFNNTFEPVTVLTVIFCGLALYLWRRKELSNYPGHDLRFALFGICWFVIFISPALVLSQHVAKRYLYLPIIGFSIITALICNYFYNKIKKDHLAAAKFFIIILSLSSFLIAYKLINEKAEAGEGYLKNAVVAENYLHDIKRKYPQLPKGSTLYFISRDPAFDDLYLWMVTKQGSLYRLYFDDTTLSVKYIDKEKLANLIIDDKTFVFSFDEYHLQDLTPSLKTDLTTD